MPSPTFRIGYAAALIGPYTYAAYDTAAAIPPNYYCKVELQSVAGVDSIAVTLPTADPVTLAAGLPVVTVDQATKTATWQHPNATGRAINVQVKINGGVDGNGTVVAAYTRSLQAYSVTAAGLVVFVVGETDQYHRTYGHTQKLQALVGSAPSSNTVPYEGSCTTTAATPTLTVVTIPTPTANCVVQFDVRINGYDTMGAVATTHSNATAYFTIGGGWVLDPAGLLEAHGYAVDPAWAFGWALGGGGSSITFTVTGDAV
ncbi:MAG: hypothetical protein WC563_15795, partial [Brevundimonas sp.]